MLDIPSSGEVFDSLPPLQVQSIALINTKLCREVYKMLDGLRIYWLAIKYWIQGDSWRKAVEYATVMVKHWRYRGY